MAAEVPDRIRILEPGVTRLQWRGRVTRMKLPGEAARIELTLPGDAWAIQTDTSGGAVDLCVPQGKLSQCKMHSVGGELFLVSDAARRARVRLILGPRMASRQLEALYEETFRMSGWLRLTVPRLGMPRQFEVTGAEHCTLILADGSRHRDCAGVLPAGQDATLMVMHAGGPVRAVAWTSQDYLQALWGGKTPATPAKALGPSRAVALSSPVMHRTIELDEAAVIHLTSDTGVCALASSRSLIDVEGAARGCDIHRLLEPGEYQFMVRSFGEIPLKGAMMWSKEPVKTLQEGIGQEEWLAPGEVRMFRFEMKSAGQIGMGIQVDADVLECVVLDSDHRESGRGCQQYLGLDPGSYLLTVRAPPGLAPARFRPVLLGLAGGKSEIPVEYLREFFQRIGESS
jgi:hypothetical protein